MPRILCSSWATQHNYPQLAKELVGICAGFSYALEGNLFVAARKEQPSIHILAARVLVWIRSLRTLLGAADVMEHVKH